MRQGSVDANYTRYGAKPHRLQCLHRLHNRQSRTTTRIADTILTGTVHVSLNMYEKQNCRICAQANTGAPNRINHHNNHNNNTKKHCKSSQWREIISNQAEHRNAPFFNWAQHTKNAKHIILQDYLIPKSCSFALGKHAGTSNAKSRLFSKQCLHQTHNNINSTAIYTTPCPKGTNYDYFRQRTKHSCLNAYFCGSQVWWWQRVISKFTIGLTCVAQFGLVV